MNLNRKIGIKIKALRIERKLSQEKLAGLSEIDRTYLQSIERGERNISLNVLMKISNALEISVSKILENIDDEL
jgi:transcriptional regulator with XRE-family HTH domain